MLRPKSYAFYRIAIGASSPGCSWSFEDGGSHCRNGIILSARHFEGWSDPVYSPVSWSQTTGLETAISASGGRDFVHPAQERVAGRRQRGLCASTSRRRRPAGSAFISEVCGTFWPIPARTARMSESGPNLPRRWVRWSIQLATFFFSIFNILKIKERSVVKKILLFTQEYW